jgi:DNA-binding NtrC family response regulator
MATRVLLVDDDAAVLSMLKIVLQSRGYHVTTAESAAAAKGLLAKTKFELVITDMKMESETAGYEVVQSASLQPYKPATIILTAFPLLAKEWKEAGAQAILVKPTPIHRMWEVIDEVLSARRKLRH